MMFLSIGSFSRSAWRVMEMAFATYETLPASIAWLLEGGGHVHTSAVSDSSYSAFMNFTASSVFLELMVMLPASSCAAPQKDHSNALMAMLVSSSWLSPSPHGLPNLSLIALAPLRRSSYVSGPFGKPTSFHKSSRQLPGSGAYESENA